ncbi:murein hydrolase activator EnvC family protein [Desulfobacterota bacterium M19]
MIRPVALIIIFFFGLNALTAAAGGNTTPTAKLNRIRAAMADQQQKVKESGIQSFNLEQELKKIDLRLRLESRKLREIQQKLNRQEDYLQARKQETKLLIKQKEAIKEHVKKRLTAFFKMGGVTLINAVFAAHSLAEAINTREEFRFMLRHDRKIIGRYRTKISLLREALNNITASKNKILEIINEEKTQEQQLIDSRIKRQKLLNRVRLQKDLYEQALREMAAGAASLEAKINKSRVPMIRARRRKITRTQRSRPRHTILISGFAAMKGRLKPPVSGKINRFFGSQNGKFGLKINFPGLDFTPAGDLKVRAVFAGRIIFAGYLAAYGNTVIIDHGQQYYTLLSGLASIYKKTGDIVQGAEVIGLAGGDGLLHKGLHFELRYGSIPIDPLPWLAGNWGNRQAPHKPAITKP